MDWLDKLAANIERKWVKHMKYHDKISKKRLVINNILYGFGTKIAIMALSIVLPRLFIVSFGSEVNGLLSTITHIFTYLALLEAGIGSATINALYRPLDDSDKAQVCGVLSEARAYYRKVTVIYILSVILFAAVYPLVANISISRPTVTAIILLQGVPSCISYYFCAAYMQLLAADGQQYVVDNVDFAIRVGTSLIRIFLVSLGYNIVLVQVGFFIISMLKIPLLIGLTYKRYPWLKLVKTKCYSSIKERGAFVVHEVSTTIFSNTDIILISTFCNFAMASVYSVYNLVFGALNSMINTANAGLGFILGQSHYKDLERFRKVYDVYSFLYSLIVFVVMTIAYVMITPFVILYTKGVGDVNYIISGLPLLFAAINIMSGFRAVAARLITVSGHAGRTSSHSIAETIINVVASLILINFWGIHGVLWGTVIALSYRMNDIIIYANKVILLRSPIKEYKRFLVFCIVFAASVLLNYRTSISADTYIELLVYAIGTSFLVLGAYALASMCFCRNEIKQLNELIKHK